MLTRTRSLFRGARPLAVVGVGLLLASSGCGMDKVTIPGLSGPSSLGYSMVMTVNPDVILANGVTSASVQATVIGPDGRPAAGRAVFFAVTDENGNFIDLGTLQSTSQTFPNPGPQVTEATQGNGIAQVIYRTPSRIERDSIERIHIMGRLVGNDANGQFSNFVVLELRPAEARDFPENPTNTPPSCSFFKDPKPGPYSVGEVIRFKSTASDPDPGDRITIYYWDFGDGTTEDQPEVQHAYRLAGSYTVFHTVTDRFGGQTTCSDTVTITP